MMKKINVVLIVLFLSLTLNAKSFIEKNDIVFKTVGNKDIKLNLYFPNENINKRYPLLIWIHGGAWKRGSKDNIVKKNPLLLKSVTKEGYALASIDYRLSKEASFPKPIQDINDAINFLYDNADKYNIDAKEVVVMGRSAGGHLAEFMGATNTHKNLDIYEKNKQPKYKVVSVVSFFGPSDFLDLSKKRGKEKLKSRKSPEAMFLGKAPNEDIELAKKASPSTYITKESPPFILLHGDKDTKVPVSQSILLKKILDENGVENRLFIEKGVGHSAKIFDSEKYVLEVIEFIKKYYPKK